jgi:hypothetical protein
MDVFLATYFPDSATVMLENPNSDSAATTSFQAFSNQLSNYFSPSQVHNAKISITSGRQLLVCWEPPRLGVRKSKPVSVDQVMSVWMSPGIIAETQNHKLSKQELELFYHEIASELIGKENGANT